jgi:hypothetical protein
VITSPRKEPIVVTDHAVLRYFERFYGFNMELIREHIAAICTAPAAFGAVCVRAEGVRFDIVQNRVVTVSPDSQSPSRIGRRLSQDKIARGA